MAKLFSIPSISNIFYKKHHASKKTVIDPLDYFVALASQHTLEKVASHLTLTELTNLETAMGKKGPEIFENVYRTLHSTYFPALTCPKDSSHKAHFRNIILTMLDELGNFLSPHAFFEAASGRAIPPSLYALSQDLKNMTDKNFEQKLRKMDTKGLLLAIQHSYYPQQGLLKHTQIQVTSNAPMRAALWRKTRTVGALTLALYIVQLSQLSEVMTLIILLLILLEITVPNLAINTMPVTITVDKSLIDLLLLNTAYLYSFRKAYTELETLTQETRIHQHTLVNPHFNILFQYACHGHKAIEKISAFKREEVLQTLQACTPNKEAVIRGLYHRFIQEETAKEQKESLQDLVVARRYA